jgi:energy-coupling factor transport system permease protein
VLSLAPVAPPTSYIVRRNPVAKLTGNALVSITVLVSVDWLTPALLLGLVLAAVPAVGVRMSRFARRLRLVTPTALTAAVVATVFAADKTGTVLVDAGPLLITESAVQNGVALGLRVLAVACCAVLAFATTDATELADSLIQQWRVPSRFAIGALAAFRLLPLLAAEWQMITMARRARGLDAGGNPLAAARLFASTMFALLVGAIRRGTRLATAMDARGFDSGIPRSIARPQRMTVTDWALVTLTGICCAAILATSLTAGVFRSVW